MNSACCIVGAGYSYVAGLPLASDLLSTAEVAVVSKGAASRFEAIWKDYTYWKNNNPLKYPEEYLADLYNNLFKRPAPPFSWAVELVACVLATPRGMDIRMTSPRYGPRVINPSHCSAHGDFWRSTTSLFGRVSVVTTNYDVLVERSLRHRPMTRVFGPGCYYGGLPRPQILKGTALPFSVHEPHRWVELTGQIPVYKLHGSLNWSRDNGSGDIKLFQDLRPAFREHGNTAIVPPIPEKETPAWLRSVWEEAESKLSCARFWIVCGYSLPSYDTVIEAMLRRASKRDVEHVLVLDPRSKDLCDRYSSIAPNADIHPLPGLPTGLDKLFSKTREILRT